MAKIVREDALRKLATLQKGYIDSKVAEAAESVTLTGKEAIDITEKVVSLKLDEANKVLSQSSTGLLATLSINYNSSSKKVELKGVGGEVISDFAADAFIADGMLADVKLEGNNLIFTFNTDAGEHTIDPIDLSKYITAYTGGDGIDITSNVVKVDVKTSDKYLTIEDGKLASKGIDAAIETAKGEVTSALEAITASNVKATKVGSGSATNVQGVLEELNTAITTLSTTGVESQIEAALEDLNLSTVGGATKYVQSVTQTDGKVTAVAADLTATAVAATAVGDGEATTVQGVLSELNTAIAGVKASVDALEYMTETEAQSLYTSIYG